MTIADFALIASILAGGMFAGLMLTLVVIMQRMWASLPVTTYIAAMQSFLPVAKGNPIITVLTLLPIVAPILVLMEGPAANSSRFLLALIGTILACGPFFVTMRYNFPIYATMMGWQAGQTPPDWQQVRTRFYRLNLTRLLLSLAATVCFLFALAA